MSGQHAHGRKREEQDEEKSSMPARKKKPSKFSRLYESRDSRLCVFEDEYGHLTSVRTSRLA